MPLSIFKKLGVGEARPTTVTLQLVDRSVTYPKRIIEEILVKVDKFIVPADFIVLDMEEDENVPIIWGRPFLATGQAQIDVAKGEVKLRVQEEEEVIFNVFNSLKCPRTLNTCFSVQDFEAGPSRARRIYDPMEVRLIQKAWVVKGRKAKIKKEPETSEHGKGEGNVNNPVSK